MKQKIEIDPDRLLREIAFTIENVIGWRPLIKSYQDPIEFENQVRKHVNAVLDTYSLNGESFKKFSFKSLQKLIES